MKTRIADLSGRHHIAMHRHDGLPERQKPLAARHSGAVRNAARIVTRMGKAQSEHIFFSREEASGGEGVGGGGCGCN